MKWKQNTDISYEDISKLANELNANELLVRILLNRTNDKEFARLTLRDIHEAIIPPQQLVNGQEVADVIASYIQNSGSIFIYADYDSDGINSGSLAYSVIKDLIDRSGSNATVEAYFPERSDGYGLSMHFAEDIVSRKDNIGDNILVMTVDNGIAQVDQITYLKNNGIEVVVTDHHKSKDIIPACLICDPHNEHIKQDETFHHLCGAGVIFKICELLQMVFGYHNMYKYVVNLAIATITDVMPLTTENIAIIKYGLELMNSQNCPVGILAMKDFLGIETMNASHIAWEIGPRLNACGRMNNTALGSKLLLASDYDSAMDIVQEIEIINDERKQITKQAKEKVSKMDFSNDYIAIVDLEDAPQGIAGIIAGQVADMLHKPSIVVTTENGISHGSARSVPGLDLHYLFNTEQEKGNLIGFGGHAEAAGVSFYQSMKESLLNSLNNTISELVAEQQEVDSAEEILLIDECIEIAHLNKETFELINDLPYDNSTFKKPVFALADCKVKDYLPTKTNQDNLWLTVQQGKQSVKFWCQGMTDIYKQLGCPKTVHLAGYVEKNFMSGRPYTLKIIDIISADAS